MIQLTKLGYTLGVLVVMLSQIFWLDNCHRNRDDQCPIILLLERKMMISMFDQQRQKLSQKLMMMIFDLNFLLDNNCQVPPTR